MALLQLLKTNVDRWLLAVGVVTSKGERERARGGAVVLSTALVSVMDKVVRLLLLDSFSFQNIGR